MKKVIGIAFILVAIGIVIIWRYRGCDQNQTPNIGLKKQAKLAVKGYIGGEKLGFMSDPKVQEIIAKKYGLSVDFQKAGSLEMVQGNIAGLDFLWPSSQIAIELHRSKVGNVHSEIIFNSPIVLYSWDIVADVLIRIGIVKRINEVYYIVDMPKLIKTINEGKKWSELGLSDLYGNVTVFCTDPTKSNSGNMFSGLLANILNNGKVANDSDLANIMPTIVEFFSRLGYMEHSSADLFDQFLKMGVGAYPMIVGYENQLVEFSIQNEKYIDLLKSRIRTLYPKPTVWSSHPIIALNDNGSKLIEALKDEEIQKLAWEKHGFRSGVVGMVNPIDILNVIGIPSTIDSVTPMPPFPIMQKIIETLSSQNINQINIPANN